MILWRKRPERPVENDTEEENEPLELDRGDYPALWISAMLTLWLPAVLILLLLCGVVCLPFLLL